MPTVTITETRINCTTSSLTATGGTSYQWNGGSTPTQATNTFTTSGTYSVTVTNANGCSTTLSKTITIGAGQAAIAGNLSGCNSVTLTASGGTTYLWDGGNTPNQATNTFTNSGTYNVIITDANGCRTSLQRNVTVTHTIAPTLNIAPSTNNICKGETVRFLPNYASAGANPTFKWFVNGQQVATTESYVSANLANNDEVYCEITGSDACSAPFISNKIKMTVNTPPQVSFLNDLVIENDGPKTLSPQVSNDALIYRWSPIAGLNNPNIKNPTANPESTTEYTLTVSGAGGCTAQATIKVVVLKEIFIPNVFSPNGDGKNDQWVIRNIADYVGTRVQIYNRYGQQVFKNDNFIAPWDGIFNGEPLPVGTYFYILDLANSSKTRYKGSVTILR
jgi:gliding motility-associated-like protein